VLKVNPSKALSFDAGRRQFLGVTGAGMFATLLPGCGGHSDNGPQYPQTIAMGQQMIQQAIAKYPGSNAGISIAMFKGSSVVWQEASGDRECGQ
jgi:hypothetical protein